MFNCPINRTTQCRRFGRHGISESICRARGEEPGHNTSAQDQDGICASVLRILDAIKEEKMTMAQFLDAYSWGNQACVTNNRIRQSRTRFLQSPTLPVLLKRWRKPPRQKTSKKKRPEGAEETLNRFALETMKETAETELGNVEALVKSSDDLLTKADLTAIHISQLQADMQKSAPTIWMLLEGIATSDVQRKRGTQKDNSKASCIIMLIISILAYCRNRFANRLQRVLAIYFKFKGLSAKGCDTLHALGIMMSTKWVTDAVSSLSAEAMRDAQTLVSALQYIISHDNMQVSFRIFSQRLDQHAEFGSGTAGTVYIRKDAPPIDPTLNRDLQVWRRRGIHDPITVIEVFGWAEESYPAIQQHMAYLVLEMLLDTPEFDLSTYEFKNSVHLNPPSPVDELPCGEDHVTLQYMLGSVPIPQATYEDNDRIIFEFLKQLGFDTPDELKKMSLERVIYWIGDQLTVDRIRGMQRFCCQEYNSLDRLDFIVAVFGWLHAMMAYAKNIHKQYLGTNAGLGLKHAFTQLRRKGLDKVSTKGPFHDNLERALRHILTAHIRTCWKVVGNVSNLAELRKSRPEALKQLAIQLVDEHASFRAVKHLRAAGVSRDEVKEQACMFNHDVLQYLVLERAIKHGDVGMMEGMLPHLAFRFAGGRNSHYTTECVELLQGLHREWPPAVADFVRKFCWLVNSTGRREGFTPVDRAQEANIGKIKVTNRSQGPNVNWEYFRKLHPVLPVIQALSEHMETEFATWTRYKKHTTPDDEKGIKLLQQTYTSARVHVTVPGRLVERESERVKDFYNNGIAEFAKTLGRWENARTYARRVDEDYSQLSDVDDEGGMMADDEDEGGDENTGADGAEDDTMDRA
ncbi:uncharacterized protein B0H18DRAFT_883006 [Fomitopsis serialis]|uniref:uncharacterized protein n=1 Tax=Fomitopsis serialis TaxID=139415 RepID=UPI0020078FEE|nr:uncharacterized protein B0H18DRAFT_883006 [Neoantrodia serialis]KAH9918160.1 hypothetical protein B0H18DRAFT_883006 [Neoantrodia serialis]